MYKGVLSDSMLRPMKGVLLDSKNPCEDLNTKKRHGGALGDKLILCIAVNKDSKYYDKVNKRDISKGLKKIYAELEKAVKDYINWYVPKDTGALRESMLFSISKRYSTVKEDQITVWFFSNKDYAEYVNEMKTHKTGPDPAVQHPFPAKFEKLNIRKGRRLEDPHAVGGFFEFILIKARNDAASFCNSFLKDLASKTEFSYLQLKNLFKIRPWSSVGKKV